MLIREAGPLDISTIRELAHRVWPKAYGSILSREQLEYMLGTMYSDEALLARMADDEKFLIAEMHGIALGFSGHSHRFKGELATKLRKLYVAPEAQRQGIGTRLIQHVRSLAREAGDLVLVLNVNRYNPAIQFYVQAGFSICKSEVIPIGQGFVMDDHVMEQPL